MPVHYKSLDKQTGYYKSYKSNIYYTAIAEDFIYGDLFMK